MILNCIQNIKNIGRADCTAEYGVISGFWLDRLNSGLSFANALLKASWITKINQTDDSQRMYVLAYEKMNITRTAEESQTQEFTNGIKVKTRNGRIEYAADISFLTVEAWNDLKAWDGAKCYIYFITKNEAIIAGDNGTNIIGVPCQIWVSEPTSPENFNGLWTLRVNIQLLNTNDNFTKAILPYDQLVGAWRPSDLYGLTDITLTQVAASGTDITVSVESTNYGNDVTGLVTGNFLIKDTNGSVVSHSNFVATGNSYSMDATLLDNYTIEVIPQGTSAPDYESREPLIIDVP